MVYRRILPLLAALLTSLPAAAQFHTMGEDPGSVRWNTIETPTYRVIYPRGLDSLGRAAWNCSPPRTPSRTTPRPG